jgi:hypothetical protein
MKKLLLTMLAFAASLTAADYSGIYNGKAVQPSEKYAGGVPYSLQMTVLQSGQTFTGTFKIGTGKPVPIVSGSVSGSSLTFSMVANSKMQSTAQLSASGDLLTGRITMSTGAVLTVALKKH